ncbi:MAG: ABC transporter ATP-binding protein [Thaumarchaeota archaeon]|nr:MAG: ABC transporter ATP-binding protein [Nitrososphaerota archaeon]TLY15591.1 MAG: ABC transporter ATP-binding protein [Nitrososphaerota archaeon]
MKGRDGDLLTVQDLHKWFPIKGGLLGKTVGQLRAVDGVSLSVMKGETLGVVGESGCGKTTLAKTILKLIKPTKGKIIFDGSDVTDLSGRKAMRLRRRMQIVFQDPYASLDPRQTVRSCLTEVMGVHGLVTSRRESEEAAENLIEKVGLNPDHLLRFPHEFSGGQRQRIAVARALVTNPDFLVLDEPTSSLDVSVQAQILNLLKSLQREFGLTYLFISHNLAVIRQVSHRTAVMYLGRMVEIAETEKIYSEPKHPYTSALVSAVPIPDPSRRTELAALEGDVPSPVNIPPGCRFNTRCPYATEKCRRETPPLVEIAPSHWIECHYDIDFPSMKRSDLERGLISGGERAPE